MWKTVEVDEIKYVFRCVKKPKGVECILFNFYQSLCENLDFDELSLRAKNLNKRLQFDNAAIVDTLVTENIYKVQRKSEHVFRFEYRVGCPFIFEWNFAEQTDKAFQKNIVLPLVDVLDSMSAQMMQLSEQLEKKDAEIAQYKLEGAELRRKTVATKPFDVNKFSTKFENIKNICQSLKDISTQACSNSSMVTILPSETKSSLEQNCKEITPTKLRKRKAAMRAEQAKLRTNKLQMEQKKKAITYLNSQSQSSGPTESIITNNMQSVEVAPFIMETVCLSTEDEEILKINSVEEKSRTSDRKVRVMLPKTLPDSQIIIKPSYRSPRKSLRFTEQEQEIIRDVKKSPKQPKVHENAVELDLDDLFSWKRKSKPDDSNTSIAQLLDALKNLDEQRLKPNFWALYNSADIFLIKLLNLQRNTTASSTSGLVQNVEHVVLPQITPLTTFLLTLAFMLPILIKLLLFTQQSCAKLMFLRTLVLCSTAAYMFGWHVHEKAILMTVVPLCLLALVERTDGKYAYLLSFVAHFSLLPLLFHPDLLLLRYALYLAYMALMYAQLTRVHNAPPTLYWFERIYMWGFVGLPVYEHVISPVLGLHRRLPYMILLLTSLYCSLGIIYFFLMYYSYALNHTTRSKSNAKTKMNGATNVQQRNAKLKSQ